METQERRAAALGEKKKEALEWLDSLNDEEFAVFFYLKMGRWPKWYDG